MTYQSSLRLAILALFVGVFLPFGISGIHQADASTGANSTYYIDLPCLMSGYGSYANCGTSNPSYGGNYTNTQAPYSSYGTYQPYTPIKANFTPYPYQTYAQYVKRADGTYGLAEPRQIPVYQFNADYSWPASTPGMSNISNQYNNPRSTGTGFTMISSGY